MAPRVTGSTPSLTPTFSFLYSRYHSKCITLSYSGLAQPLAFNDPIFLPATFTGPADSRSRPPTTCVARSTTISCTSLMTRKEHPSGVFPTGRLSGVSLSLVWPIVHGIYQCLSPSARSLQLQRGAQLRPDIRTQQLAHANSKSKVS